MHYLLDTNIVSEINRRAPNTGVLRWFEEVEDTDLCLSVITIGEIRKGIEHKRRTDPDRAERLERMNTMRTDYRDRMVPISAEVFDTGVTEDMVKELAGRKPLRVVFRNNGFSSDAVKINVDQIFKQLSPGTDIKSI